MFPWYQNDIIPFVYLYRIISLLSFQNIMIVSDYSWNAPPWKMIAVALVKSWRQICYFFLTSKLRRESHNVLPTLPQHWIVGSINKGLKCCNDCLDATWKSWHQIHNVLSMSILWSCTNVSSVLLTISNMDYSWSHGNMSILVLPQSCKED